MTRNLTGKGKDSDGDYYHKDKRKLSAKKERSANINAERKARGRYDKVTWHNMSYTDAEIRKRNKETGRPIKWKVVNGVRVPDIDGRGD